MSQNRLDLNLAWYRRNYKDNYNIIKMTRKVLEEHDEAYPDAACPHASRLLFELLPTVSIMCGKFKNSRMEKAAYHVWVFDMDAKVHIDITVDQFPIKNKNKLTFFRESDTQLMEKFGYLLEPLSGWNELFSIGPYNNFSLSKMKLTYNGKETLQDLYNIIKRRLSV